MDPDVGVVAIRGRVGLSHEGEAAPKSDLTPKLLLLARIQAIAPKNVQEKNPSVDALPAARGVTLPLLVNVLYV
jgi:hypothetical protein